MMAAPADPLCTIDPVHRPILAASLILFDQSLETSPAFLLGRRHANHVFLPGKFVFPGGCSEPEDAQMKVHGALAPIMADRLRNPTAGIPIAAPDALALTAIRELFEETGLLLGERSNDSIDAPPGTTWDSFAAAHISPDLSKLHYVARALTPPGYARRFDTHFFAANAVDIAETKAGYVNADTELVELAWVTLSELSSLDIMPVTHFIAEAIAQRLAAGLGHDLPIPYFHMQDDRWTRAEL